MTDEMKCKFCFGTGQKVEMTPVRLGEKLSPYQPCPSCGGTGVPPNVRPPRKSMRRVS
jgi:DnaJ-class molecular chaperone